MEPIDIVLQSIQNNLKQVEVLSHNMANANTPGYQAEQVFASHSAEQGSVVVRQPVSIKGSGIVETDRPLDVAIVDEGFLVVEKNNQQYLTRLGRFHIDNTGMLKHTSGGSVVGENDLISMPEGVARINTQGEVLVNGEVVDSLLVVSVSNRENMKPMGDGLYAIEEGISPINGNFQSRSINAASVSTSHDMVRLIELSRHTESLQKAVLAADQISNAGINELGKR
jgi:flagellar basal body rod protein FlgG